MAILFAGGNLKVISVSGNSVVVSGVPNACGGGKTAELRRPGVTGIREFVGNVVSSSKDGSNYRIAFDPESLPSSTRPKVGESLVIYCSNTKSSSSRSGGTTTIDPAAITSGSGFPWIWVIGGGALLFFLMNRD